ncbi:hypothetical protein QCA50_012224 [Cerrena zonata]|uniref:Uncharacterized protein n=1 Tax=Cerrena zonata TaxID=2478898 RepID=A0AAW0FUV3_9APHY
MYSYEFAAKEWAAEDDIPVKPSLPTSFFTVLWVLLSGPSSLFFAAWKISSSLWARTRVLFPRPAADISGIKWENTIVFPPPVANTTACRLTPRDMAPFTLAIASNW